MSEGKVTELEDRAIEITVKNRENILRKNEYGVSGTS